MIIAKNTVAALNAAVAYAQLENYDIYGLAAARVQDMYELSFGTDLMEYLFYIDAETLEVLGFDASPADPDVQNDCTLCA